MKTINTIKAFALILMASVFLTSCGKDADQSGNPIQQGNTIIEINAISAGYFNFLVIRYNNVITAPINASITFYLKDGQQKNIRITIPANNKNLFEWTNNKFLNSWDYTDGYKDSTNNSSAPTVNRNWDVSSVKITAVSCPDKEYGFKVLTTDDWTFYQPKELITSVSFLSNRDTVSYSSYDFMGNFNQYRIRTSDYYFSFFNNRVMLYSDLKPYPLYEGMIMDIPLLMYTYNSQNYGSQPGGPQPSLNASTIVLTITKVTETHFDAIFSGKLWSPRHADPLDITHGEIKNAKLPRMSD